MEPVPVMSPSYGTRPAHGPPPMEPIPLMTSLVLQVHGAKSVFEKLNTPPRPIATLQPSLCHLTAGTQTSVGGIMYDKVETRGSHSAHLPIRVHAFQSSGACIPLIGCGTA